MSESLTANQSQLPVIATDLDAAGLIRTVGMGDVSSLSPEQCLKYIGAICRSVGLNALTMPIRIIEIDGRKVLYATSEAGAQLRSNHEVDIEVTERKEEHGCFITVATARLPDGRKDQSVGATPVIYPDDRYDRWKKTWGPHPKAGQHMTGIDYANAVKKSETQAKRRVALSIVGLGILDESELDDMKRARAEVVTDHTQIETASDRAAAINALDVEVQTLSVAGQSNAGAGSQPTPTEPDTSKEKAGADEASPAPASESPATPETTPVRVQPPPDAGRKPAQDNTPLTDTQLADLQAIIEEITPMENIRFLNARGHLPSGSPLGNIRPAIGHKILGNVKSFRNQVSAWLASPASKAKA